MSFRIRTKLTIAFFGIIFPFLVIAGIITVYNVNNISKFALKAEAISEEMHSVMSLQIALDRALMPGNDYIITGDKKYIDEFNNTSKNVEALIEKAEDALIRLKGIDTPEVKDEMEIFNDVKSAWQHIKEISLKIFAIQNPVGSEEAATLMEEMDYKWSYPAIEKLDRHHEIDRKEHEEAIEKVNRAWKMSWIIMISGAMLLIAFGTSFAAFYSRIFTKPIEIIHNGADAIASGDFKARLDIKTGDELQQLANAMNEMAAQLDSFTSNLQGMVDERTREVQESEKRYRSLFDNMLNGFAYCRMLFKDDLPQDFIYLDVNKAFEKLTGLKNVVGKKVTEVIPGIKEAHPELFEIYGRVALTGRPEMFEIDFKPLSIWLAISVYSPERGCFVAVLDNITERKRAEERLRQSEERSRLFFNSGNDAVFVHIVGADGKPGNFIEVNEVACKRLGYTREELLNMSPYDIDASDMAEKREAVLKGFIANGQALFEMVHVAKDGTRIPVEINIRLFNLRGRPMVIAFVRDITERKKAEEALRQSRALYLNTLESMMEGCQIIDFDWRYIYVNDAGARHGCRAKEELLGHKMMELYPGIENTEMFAALRRCMNERMPHHMENEFIYPNGTNAWFELSMQPVPEGVFILSIDITERKKAEEGLRESETRFRGIVETAKDAVVCIKQGGIIYLWNKSAEEIFGYKADEVMNRSMHDVLCPERYREKAAEGLKGFSRTGTGPVVGKTIEIEGLKKDGTEFPVELSISAMNIKGEWHAAGIIRDITARKEAEKKIAEQIDFLERFHKASVQREFRIKELRDRVKELEEELKKR